MVATTLLRDTFNPYPDPAPADDPDRIIVDPDGGSGAAAGEEIDDPNFSLASLRGNAVLRWEYSPGSTLLLVWTQNRSDTESIGTFRTGGDGTTVRGGGGQHFPGEVIVFVEPLVPHIWIDAPPMLR